MGYFNTNRERGATLERSQKKARSQEDRIFDFFRGMGRPLATFEVRKMLFQNKTPTASVQRAITNLTEAGRLEKVDIKRKFAASPYGKRVHVWRVADQKKRPREGKLFTA